MAHEVRAALVGVGFGTNNAQAIAKHPRGRVVALCDLDEAKMDEFEKELGDPVKKYTNFSDVCRDKEVDLVLIWTPNQLHTRMGLEAIEHGKHLMITKPLADNLGNAERLVNAAESAGVVNMMSLSFRFGPDVQLLGKKARAGVFGDLYYGRASSMRRSGIPNWNLGFIEAGGGAFRDMGVHVLDAAWWIMGMPQPVSVSGVAGAKFGPRGQGYFSPPPRDFYSRFASDDYGGGFVRFDNGAGLLVESFWACHQPNSGLGIDLFGTEGGAKLNPLSIYQTVDGVQQQTDIEKPKQPSSWDVMADHLIRCILDGAPCQAPLRHGLTVQKVLEGLLSSAATGSEVRLV